MVALALLAVGLIGTLTWQNRLFRETLERYRNPPIARLPGERLPDISVAGLDGAEYSLRALLDASGGGGVLTVFTTTCVYCDAAIPAWKQLHEKLNRRMSVLSLSLDSAIDTRRYATAREMTWKVFLLARARLRS